jgi:uncharacterized membrane protein
MKNTWKYISTLLTGIIAGLLIFLKLKDPDQVINDNTQIAKMKQRGQGNSSSISIDPNQYTPEEENSKTREEKREDRKINRIAKRRERRERKQASSS